MEYKPTTKIVLSRGNGKSMECIDVENVLKPFLKGLCKIFYKKILWFRKI